MCCKGRLAQTSMFSFDELVPKDLLVRKIEYGAIDVSFIYDLFFATILNIKCCELLIDFHLGSSIYLTYMEMKNMIGMNIRVLRKKHKFSQEQLAEKVNVSRQTVAKWENGEALPDIFKCKILAELFQVTLDQLSRDMSEEAANQLAPTGKQFFGVVKVGDRGQIVIPKQAREMYQIQAGDKLIVLGEDATKGIALLKSNHFMEFVEMIQKAEREVDESE